MGNLASLTTLSLSSNQLSGQIPPEVGSLANLQALGLSDNQLSGTIPPELGNIANLTYVYLVGNNLSGIIPAELGNLSELGRAAAPWESVEWEGPFRVGQPNKPKIDVVIGQPIKR